MHPQVMVVCGEASGDQHASQLVAALKKRRPELQFFGMGGDKLKAQGVELIHGSHEISVMGISEVVPKLFRILQVMRELVDVAKARKPVCAILVDVPDFNLRLAKQLKSLGISVAYYVSPMVWAWRSGRTKIMAERIDELLCILPFEEKFLRDRGVNATYVGSPVLEQMPEDRGPVHFRKWLGLNEAAPTLAVLPGSRGSELKRLLPVMVEAAAAQAKLHPGLQVVVPIAPLISKQFVLDAFSGSGVTPVLVDGRAPECVGASDVALVASGTATLEAGLMNRPVVCIYKVTPSTYLVGKTFVKISHFCLVNLLAGRQVVPELLQGEVTAQSIVNALEPLWAGPARELVLTGLQEVRASLGAPGAAERAAERVAALIDRATAKSDQSPRPYGPESPTSR